MSNEYEISFIDGPDYSKMTVDQLNRFARSTDDYDKIVKLCELGANDYEGIFHEWSHCVKTSVYLLNKGYISRIEGTIPDVLDVYLKAGAGRILMYYPEFLKLPAAQPYLKRHADITELLAKKLIPDIIKEVLQFLSYEIPKVSDEEMDALEKLAEDAMSADPIEDDDLPEEALFERVLKLGNELFDIR